MKKYLSLFLFIIILLELGLKLNESARMQLNNSDQSEVLFFGGKMLSGLEPTIRNAFLEVQNDKTLAFQIKSEMSSIDVFEYLKKIKHDNLPKQIFLMLGHGENPNALRHKMDSNSYTPAIYSLIKRKETNSFTYLKSKLDQVLKNQDFAENFVFFDLLQNHIKRKIKKNELYEFKKSIYNYTTNHPIVKKFKTYPPSYRFSFKQSEVLKHALRILYLTNYDHHKEDSFLISPILFNENNESLSRSKVLNTYQAFFSQKEICNDPPAFKKSSLYFMEKIILCHVYNTLSSGKTTKQIIPLVFSLGFNYTSYRDQKKTEEKISKDDPFAKLKFHDFNQAFKAYLLRTNDSHFFLKNLLKIKSFCLENHISVYLLQFPGFNDPFISDVAKKADIRLLSNPPIMENIIKSEGKEKVLLKTLDGDTGLLTTFANELWKNYFIKQLKE